MNKWVFGKTATGFVASIILVATLVVAAFGFMAMGGSGAMVMGCLNSAPGAACSILGPLEHFEAHLHTFQNISTAIVKVFSSPAALGAAMLFLLLAALTFSFFNDNVVRIIDDGMKSRRLARALAVVLAPVRRMRFTRWLTLREMRDPSVSLIAVNA